jgi:hypothetical protein
MRPSLPTHRLFDYSPLALLLEAVQELAVDSN